MAVARDLAVVSGPLIDAAGLDVSAGARDGAGRVDAGADPADDGVADVATELIGPWPAVPVADPDADVAAEGDGAPPDAVGAGSAAPPVPQPTRTTARTPAANVGRVRRAAGRRCRRVVRAPAWSLEAVAGRTGVTGLLTCGLAGRRPRSCRAVDLVVIVMQWHCGFAATTTPPDCHAR